MSDALLNDIIGPKSMLKMIINYTNGTIFYTPEVGFCTGPDATIPDDFLSSVDHLVLTVNKTQCPNEYDEK